MVTENEIEVGYSQRTAGANGLITSSDCIGNPTIVAMDKGVFAPNCILYQRDVSTNYQTLVWKNIGDSQNITWKLQATLDANVITTKVTIASADVLALNGSPIELIAAPGAGKSIEVMGVQGRIVFNSAAYTTNTKLQIIDKGTGKVLAEDDTLLAAAADQLDTIPLIATTNGIEITDGGAVQATVATGDPAAGDSDLDIYITYKVNTL